MDQRASRRYRLRNRKDIQRLFDGGRRVADGTITLLAVPNELRHSRLAVGVSTRHGKAVRRNRIKRLCREAFRLIRSQLPAGHDYMIIPRVGADVTLSGLQESLKALAPRVAPAEEPGTGGQ